jgi:RNase P/RNase MRP subunit POP5
MDPPKIEFRHQKLMELLEETVRKTFRFLSYESFTEIQDIEPFEQKSARHQEILAEVLKQLFGYAVRTAMVVA